MVRADMKSASSVRESLSAAGKQLDELSASSVVGRAAHIPDEQTHIATGKPAYKQSARQAPGFNGPPRVHHPTEEKVGLRTFNDNGSSMYLGLRQVNPLISRPMKNRSPMWRTKPGLPYLHSRGRLSAPLHTTVMPREAVAPRCPWI
jgi:hypothetical protein